MFKNEFLMISIVPVQDSGFFLAFSFSTLVFSLTMENLMVIIQCKKLSNPTSLPLSATCVPLPSAPMFLPTLLLYLITGKEEKWKRKMEGKMK